MKKKSKRIEMNSVNFSCFFFSIYSSNVYCYSIQTFIYIKMERINANEHISWHDVLLFQI